MKIAMVAQQADPRPDDAFGLASALARQGHQVTVLTGKAGGPGAGQRGLRVIPVGAGDDPLAQVPVFSDALRAAKRPDVVHAVNWTSGLAALAAARDLDVPVVQTFSALGGPRSGGRMRLEAAIGRSAAAVVATTSRVAADLARLGVPRTSVRCIPWGVDTGRFSPEGPVASRSGRPRLVAVADLAEREPLETLIWALAKVPGAELIIAGGPGDNGYRALAASIGLSERVQFTGRAELPALLRSADLVLSTGAYETCSVEAMACGKPVVAPPTGGHQDAVLDGTTGIFIPPGRPMLLAQRIRHLLAHPVLLEAYGVAAADRARSRYSWDRIAAETAAVYEAAALPDADRDQAGVIAGVGRRGGQHPFGVGGQAHPRLGGQAGRLGELAE
jgi:glycosyltransferase involved in cell wall biosynthesis